MSEKFKFLTSMILKVSEVNGRSNKIVLGVLIILLVLGVMYWINVLDKEQYLIKRNFRLLNLWSHEISNKIDSMNTVSKLAFMELENEQNISLQKYSCLQSNSDSEVPEYVLKRLCAAGLDNIEIKQGGKEVNQPVFVFDRDTKDKKLIFNIEAWHPPKESAPGLALEADLDLSEFIAKLTNEQIFENVLLISNKRKILFQKVSKEYSWQNWKNIEHQIQEDTWFNFFEDSTPKGEPEKNKLDLAPHFFNFKSPHGEQFTIFIQSIHLPGRNEVGEETYYIAGIVSGTQFRQSYLSISSKALFVATAVLLSLVLSLPFIRLRMMGSTDPLKSFHICILLFSMSLGSGLLTILFLDIGFSETGKRIIGEQMKRSAKNIADQTKTELNDVLGTLAYADKNGKKLGSIEKPIKNNKMWLRESMICGVPEEFKLWKTDHNCYPDYSLIYWMDSQGKLRENWTANGFPGYETPLSLIKRAYVSNVLEERQNLWRIKNPREYNFFLDPIISWSTGINRVVASMQSKRSNDSSKIAGPSVQVAALQFEFLSLMKDVVVPPGIGFMVVDDKDFRVLFHSNQQRALRTNFLVETDNNQVLRNLVWAGESDDVEGRYWGSDTHFYVLPFDDLPWTLIVYRDREILSSASLVAMVIACSLFTIWTLIIYGIPWFIGWVLRGRFYLKKSWLWPNQKHHSSYRAISIINSILFLSGLCVFWVLSNVPEWLLVACLASLFLGLIASFIIFSGRKNNASLNATVEGNAGFFTILSYPYSYSTMVSTYLLIFSVLPAIAIMGAVYQKEMATTVQHQLLKLTQALNDTTKPIVVFSGNDTEKLKASGITPIEYDQSECCLGNPGQQYGLLGFYPDFLFDSTWRINCSVTGDKSTIKTLFDSFYDAVSYYFLPLKKGGENWGLVTNGSNEDQIYWSTENSRVTLNGNLRTRIVDLYQPKYPVVTEHKDWHDLTITASANLPIQSLIFGGKWFERQNPYTYLLYSVLMCIWISFIYKVPQITANNTLFLFRPRRKNAELPLDLKILLLDTTPNLIVVGYPGQGKAQQLKQLVKDAKEHVTYLNLRHIPEQDWVSCIDSSKIACINNEPKPIIIIDQFEFRCNEPDINYKKLELLEKIVRLSSAGSCCHMYVISNAYPGVFPLSVGGHEAQDTSQHQREVLSARWHKLWEAFGLVYYAMNDKESNHDKHNEWLRGELGDNRLPPMIWNKMSEDFLRPHYQAIWQSATLDEQLALYNLARDQFIHVKHPGLNSLLCKGLIKFSPDLRLMDPRFESFVRYAGKLDQLDQFAKKHRAGNWSLIKVPLGITFVIFFAFLAITQEEFRSIFPALISILPVFFQGMPDLTQFFKGSDKA